MDGGVSRRVNSGCRMLFDRRYRCRKVPSVWRRTACCIFAAVVQLVLSLQPTRAEDFYKGKTITVTVGMSAGGGYDAYARLVSQFLGRHIPGQPNLIVQNMPGGGGIRAAVNLYKTAPKDGTVLSVIIQSIAFSSRLAALPEAINANDFTYIGRLTDSIELQLTWFKSPIKNLEDAIKHKVVIGETGVGSTSVIVPLLLNKILGTKFQSVMGYPGTAEVTLAMENGEVDGVMKSVESVEGSYPQWLTEKKVNIIYQVALKPHPDFPNVPAVGQLGTTPRDKASLRFVAATAEIGRSLAAPPGVPVQQARILRRAFDEMVVDPDFLAAARARHLPIDPLPGAKLQNIVTDVMNTPSEVVEDVNAIMRKTR